tara:strand:+ start:5026 stop:5358 length:333 start_codon:yes stop_codon:yes gene_type:complete
MLSKSKVKGFRTDFQAAVQQLEKEYGVNINLGAIRFNAHEMRAKMTATTGAPIEKLSTEDFKLGDIVKVNHKKCIGKTYTITKIMKKNIRIMDNDGFGQVRVSPGLLIKA